VVEANCWPRLEVFRDLRRGLRQLRLHELYGLQKLGGLECCVVSGDRQNDSSQSQNQSSPGFRG
jgi:hypothetical protein